MAPATLGLGERPTETHVVRRRLSPGARLARVRIALRDPFNLLGGRFRPARPLSRAG